MAGPRSLAAAALVLLTLSAGPAAQTRACGVERWPVKVAVDADVGRLDSAPVASTIAALQQLPRPARPLPYNRRIAPAELTVFRVKAVLRQVLTESDGDWHLVLEDPERPGSTLIGEVPDPDCAIGSAFAERYARVRRDLRAVPRFGVVELDGIGFFDYVHGQRGVARNGIELHPVLRARVVGGPAPVPDPSAPSGGAADSVWVNSASSVYHCPGTRWYGVTRAGYFTTERKAIAAGARPAYGRSCSRP